MSRHLLGVLVVEVGVVVVFERGGQVSWGVFKGRGLEGRPEDVDTSSDDRVRGSDNNGCARRRAPGGR